MTVVTIQQRRATSTEWSTKNPILKAGEIGFEIDTGKFKCGNGITPWDELVYISGDVNAVQNTGQSTTQVMSQKAVTDELEGKVDKEDGKGLIEPAPVDGKEYARKDGAWVEVVGGGGGGGDVEEAPLDGEMYLRGNGTWNKYAGEKIIYVDFPLENGVPHKFTEADFTDTTAVYKGTAQYNEFIFVPYTASFRPDLYAWIAEVEVGGVTYKVVLLEGEAMLMSSPVTYTVDSQYRPAGVNRIRYDGYFDQLLDELSMKVLFEVDSSYVADTVLTFDIPKEPFLSGATELESFFSNLDKSATPDVVSATDNRTANGFSAGKLYWEIDFDYIVSGQAEYMKISYSSERSGSQTHEFSVTV